ncbi:transcription elongation factor GreA [Candidatus Saccharibacteria bacterium]|nr:transcription elongation factor GreA [Candidatus Saccharibacteria bacterium]
MKKDDKVLLTKQGLVDLEKELADLKAKRPEIANKIKEAKDYGDLSENASYDEAREEQAFMEGRIEEIESMLKRVEIVSNHHSEEVEIGSVVKVIVNGEQKQYRIVGSTEANPLEGKLSNESPVGSSLIGRRSGEKVEIEIPVGTIIYEIIAVN